MKSVLSVVLSATAPWSVTSHTAPVIAGDKPVWYGAEWEWHPATNAATRKGARHTGWRWRWRWACKCCIVQNFLVIKVINKNETTTTTAAGTQHQFSFFSEKSRKKRDIQECWFSPLLSGFLPWHLKEHARRQTPACATRTACRSSKHCTMLIRLTVALHVSYNLTNK